jgi:prolyl-tRNA editing enzyme YbaK/EbsC (Cys-tRNA(Pro) deacylase)
MLRLRRTIVPGYNSLVRKLADRRPEQEQKLMQTEQATNDGGRSLTTADLARFIADHGIAATLLTPETETPTVPAAAKALGVSERQIIKSLLFVIRDEPLLVIASGAALVDRRALAERFGTGKKQVRLADAATVLRLTGYPVGGVPPFGHLVPVSVLLDTAIRQWDAVYGGGGDERTLVKLTPAELARATNGEWIGLGE